jgi:hypothetical protein
MSQSGESCPSVLMKLGGHGRRQVVFQAELTDGRGAC